MGEYRIEAGEGVISDLGIDFFLDNINGVVLAHIHPAVEILYIQKGRCCVMLDDAEYYADAGDMVLIRSNTVHCIYPADGGSASYYVLKIHPSLFFDFSSRANGGKYAMLLSMKYNERKNVWRCGEVSENGIAAAMDRLIAGLDGTDSMADVEMKIATAEIILAVLRSNKVEELAPETADGISRHITRQVYDSVIYVNGHYTEDITAADCAARVNMSYSYFSRCFHQITSKTFKEYLNIMRINRAERELLLSEKTETEIAAVCGYGNISYFISVFRRIKGVTPSAYRAKYAKNEK